jgi:hypothetical protein
METNSAEKPDAAKVRAANLRLGLVLFTIAAAFLVGCIVRQLMLH